MSKNILEGKSKKTLESMIRAFGGESSVAAVKKLGRAYLDKRSKRLKHSLLSDIERLRALKPALLQFGCGSRIMSGWANIDIAKPEVVMREIGNNNLLYDFHKKDGVGGGRADYFQIDFIEAGIPLPDSSVSGIWHEDFIEHISQRDVFVFLAETLRVLKPGGVHRISTPDLKGSMLRHADFKLGKAGVYTNEWNKHGHINVFTPVYLEETARLIGYSKVTFADRNVSRLKPLPREWRPGPDRLDSEQIFCDLIK